MRDMFYKSKFNRDISNSFACESC